MSGMSHSYDWAFDFGCYRINQKGGYVLLKVVRLIFVQSECKAGLDIGCFAKIM